MVKLNLHTVKKIASQVSIPVVANGDIDSPKKLKIY